jgi:hypothetical protein
MLHADTVCFLVVAEDVELGGIDHAQLDTAITLGTVAALASLGSVALRNLSDFAEQLSETQDDDRQVLLPLDNVLPQLAEAELLARAGQQSSPISSARFLAERASAGVRAISIFAGSRVASPQLACPDDARVVGVKCREVLDTLDELRALLRHLGGTRH